MTARSHLKEMHTAAADFHARAASAHATIAKCFGKMDVEGAEDLRDAHQELAKAHADAGQFAVSCCKTLDMGKATGMGDVDIEPRVQGVARIFPMPRAGAPTLGDVAASVPTEFAKLVSVEDDE